MTLTLHSIQTKCLFQTNINKPTTQYVYQQQITVKTYEDDGVNPVWFKNPNLLSSTTQLRKKVNKIKKTKYL